METMAVWYVGAVLFVYIVGHVTHLNQSHSTISDDDITKRSVAWLLCADLERIIEDYLRKANAEVDRYNRSVKDAGSCDLFE